MLLAGHTANNELTLDVIDRGVKKILREEKTP